MHSRTTRSDFERRALIAVRRVPPNKQQVFLRGVKLLVDLQKERAIPVPASPERAGVKNIGIRELKNRISTIVRDVQAGLHVMITSRGVVVAKLLPRATDEPG